QAVTTTSCGDIEAQFLHVVDHVLYGDVRRGVATGRLSLLEQLAEVHFDVEMFFDLAADVEKVDRFGAEISDERRRRQNRRIVEVQHRTDCTFNGRKEV